MVLSWTTEAELADLFDNVKDACMLFTTLADMGFPQPATPIHHTNNAVALGQITPLQSH
jgi:hypothetical protein